MKFGYIVTPTYLQLFITYNLMGNGFLVKRIQKLKPIDNFLSSGGFSNELISKKWSQVHISRHCGSENYLTGHRQTAFSDPQCLENWTKPGS
jgi:hypothetical protein